MKKVKIHWQNFKFFSKTTFKFAKVRKRFFSRRNNNHSFSQMCLLFETISQVSNVAHWPLF